MASTLSQLQFGRLYAVRAKVLRRYKHHSLLWCLNGLYGCRWRRQESRTQPGDCCCNKVRKRPTREHLEKPRSALHCQSSCQWCHVKNVWLTSQDVAKGHRETFAKVTDTTVYDKSQIKFV